MRPTGGHSDWVNEGILYVGPDPVVADRLLQAVAHADAGASVLFLGTVRRSTGTTQTDLLHYEAYGAMAEDVLRGIAAAARSLWPGVRLAIAHRTGDLRPGDVAVGVAAAASHRGDAFDAARFCVERLKLQLPVWKKEHLSDGSAYWVDHP